MLIPPESGLQLKGSLARFRNPAKGSFPRWLAGWLGGRVRIATKRIFGQFRNQPRVHFPDSGLIPDNSGFGIIEQQSIYSAGVRVATNTLIPLESGLQ